ncbi:major facilitator superfamily domain-containing protein [Thelephora terrestris]|uniref:Major facilitator superfamily domain-containing protein n=1 Tax=Thelephora terrestris TaxID=56493 RepID=A0A9P6H193_9AGAM|nr:major facilitator superfamily domain-containing protein [Thelephora terrestris]
MSQEFTSSPTPSRKPSGASSIPATDFDDPVDRVSPVLPIDWAPSIKYLVLFQVVAHAGMASWCASAFIPAFSQMSQFFHRPIDDITYLVGAYTLMMGFGVLLWNPLADRYGRRPVLLFSLSECLIATCGAAMSKTYASIMVARIFQGFGICAPLSLGAAYMKEMYSPRNRGTALGIWTLGITCGPFIAHHSTWTWIVWLEALMLTAILLFEVVFLPEAIPGAPCFRNLRSFGDVLFQLPTSPNTITGDFFLTTRKTLVAARYPSVWLAGLAFAVPYGYIAVSISSLFPVVYGGLYHFNPSEQGLLYLPLLAGSLLAECGTGRMGDKGSDPEITTSTSALCLPKDVQSDSTKVPEMRLVIAFPGILICIASLLWFGFGVEKHLHWAHLAVASGLGAYGTQMVTSIIFSYIVDCWPKSAKEVVTIMNLFRVISSFVVLFYNQRLNKAVGYGLAFGIEAIVSAVFGLGGIVVLIAFGGKFR